jgi:uncharacterized protein DUF3846
MTVIAIVSRGDLDSEPQEVHRIVAGHPRVVVDASTITITPRNEVIVNAWPVESLLSHAYEQLECQTVGALDLDAAGVDFSLWYDDEALYNGAPEINELATKICGLQGPLCSEIIGTVMLTGIPNREGDTQPLSRDQAQLLLDLLGELHSAPMPEIHR